MSVETTTHVIKHSKEKGSRLLLLLIIANSCNSEGANAFPSYATMARDSRLSRRQVIRIIAALADKGELIIEEGDANQINFYRIPMTPPTGPSDKMSLPKKPISQGKRSKQSSDTAMSLPSDAILSLGGPSGTSDTIMTLPGDVVVSPELVTNPTHASDKLRGDYKGGALKELSEGEDSLGAVAPPSAPVRNFVAEYIDRWRAKYPERDDASAPHLRETERGMLKQMFDGPAVGKDMAKFSRILDGYFGSAWPVNRAYSVQCLVGEQPDRWLYARQSTGRPEAPPPPPGVHYSREELARRGIIDPPRRGLQPGEEPAKRKLDPLPPKGARP